MTDGSVASCKKAVAAAAEELSPEIIINRLALACDESRNDVYVSMPRFEAEVCGLTG